MSSSKGIETGLHYPIRLDAISKAWSVDYIGKFFDQVQSGFACGEHNTDRRGIIHIRPMNISRKGEVELDDVRYIAPEYDSRRLLSGDVLFNNTNSPALVGKTAFVDKKGADLAYSNHMTCLRGPRGVSPKFVSLQLHYLWSCGYFLHRCVKHVNQASVSSTELGKSVPLVVPPISYQNRVVAKVEELFSELDKSVESLRSAQEQLQVYRQALLKSAFEGALTAEWRRGNASRLRSSKDIFKLIRDVRSANKDRIKSARAKKFNESAFNESDVSIPLRELPNGWAWVQIGHISTGPSYGTSIKSQPQGDCPVLRMGNIQSCEFDFGDLVFTSDKEEIQKYLLAKGDVLFNRTNSPELVGKTAIFELNTPCIFAGYLVRVNHLPQLVDPHYLNFYLNSPVAKFQGNKVKTDGVNQSNINAEKLSKYPFPYCSIEEQREIVERLKSEMSGIKHLDETLTLEIRRAESLRQTILKRAFQGDLVPQNPEGYSCGILFDHPVAQEAPPNQQAPHRISAKNRTSKTRKKNEHIDHRL